MRSRTSSFIVALSTDSEGANQPSSSDSDDDDDDDENADGDDDIDHKDDTASELHDLQGIESRTTATATAAPAAASANPKSILKSTPSVSAVPSPQRRRRRVTNTDINLLPRYTVHVESYTVEARNTVQSALSERCRARTSRRATHSTTSCVRASTRPRRAGSSTTGVLMTRYVTLIHAGSVSSNRCSRR